MPIPIVTHPKPARNPAVAPQTTVVLGSFKKKARFMAMITLRTKLMENVFPGELLGSPAENQLALFQAFPNMKDEDQIPPITNAETAAARTAKRFTP